MSRLIYYILIFTHYTTRPCAYPIFPKLRGNLTPRLAYAIPILFGCLFFIPINPSLAPHSYSLLSAYLRYFPYTPFLLSYLVYSVGYLLFTRYRQYTLPIFHILCGYLTPDFPDVSDYLPGAPYPT